MLNPLSSLIGKPFINTIVLFRIPKCASSSLWAAVGHRNLFWRERKFLEEKLSADKKYNGLFDVSHVTPAESYRLFSKEILNYFSVCCVRNPYDRAVSSYSFSRGKNFGDNYGLPNDGEFSDYCEILWKKRHDKTFWPTILQSEYACGVVPIKCRLRFESLNQDWLKMIKEFEIRGLPESLPWENKTDHKPWQEFYDQRCKDIVDEVLDLDFKLGYRKEIV